MPEESKRYGLGVLFALISLSSFGQDIYTKYNIYRNPVKVFINKFSITATTGLSVTDYKQTLSGVYFYQDAENQYIFSNDIENLGATFDGYTNWLNNPTVGFNSTLETPFTIPFEYLQNPVFNPGLNNETFLVNTDTTDFGFREASRGVPITLMLHYGYQDFRIGLGYSYELHYMRPLEATQFGGQVRDYQPDFRRTRYSRLFGMVGYRFYRFWDYDFVAELQVGRIRSGGQFNSATISRGLYTNVGLSIENNFSEYFRVIVRPSVDFKSYTVNIPDGSTVRHGYPTFSIQAGISINVPDIRRSPMKGDHVQLKHLYTDPKTGRVEEVRGQPIYKKQNPKVGENHRKLWRYKRKNKKKLNPTGN